jgi:hypothetical protein
MNVRQIKHSISPHQPYRAWAGSVRLGSEGCQGINRMMMAGMLIAISYAATGAAVASPIPQNTGAEADVLKAEEAFRLAKLNNDVVALKQILADEYYGINQYGAERDKSALLDLFQQFKLSSLMQPTPTVRVSGDFAIVSGQMTEVNPAGQEKLIFVRVYVRRAQRWQLLSSAQFIPTNP